MLKGRPNDFKRGYIITIRSTKLPGTWQAYESLITDRGGNVFSFH